MMVSLPEMASTGTGVKVGLAVAKGVGVGSPIASGVSAMAGAAVGTGAVVAVGSGCTELLQATPISNTEARGMRNIARGLNHLGTDINTTPN